MSRILHKAQTLEQFGGNERCKIHGILSKAQALVGMGDPSRCSVHGILYKAQTLEYFANSGSY